MCLDACVVPYRGGTAWLQVALVRILDITHDCRASRDTASRKLQRPRFRPLAHAGCGEAQSQSIGRALTTLRKKTTSHKDFAKD